MNLRKKLIVISSLITGLFLVGSIIYASSMNASNKEVEATNIGDETYRTFLLSTNNKATTDNMYISFDNFASSQEMHLIQSFSSKDKLFVAKVPNSSISGSTVYFRNGSHSISAYTSKDDTTNYYVLNGTATASSIKNTVGKVNDYLPSAFTTRRLWVTLSTDVSGFLGLFGSTYRYMFNSITNSVDGRTYYYVDIPSNWDNFNISYISGDCSSNTVVLNRDTFSNTVMHRINYINVSSKAISQYDPTGLDQYFINEYLRGFSTCLDSDVNGFGAYSPYITNMMSYYHLDESLLESVYQDDYLRSDYDDGYISTTIRGGYVVSAKDKLDELDSRYDLKNNLIKIDQDTSDNGLIVVVISSTVSLSVIMGYIFFKRIKHN